MNDIYILHAGATIIDEAIDKSLYKDIINSIDPSLNSKFLRILRKLHFKLNIQSKKIWVDISLQKYEIKNVPETTLILFDTPIWMENIEYIKSKYNNVKIVFWFWNIVRSEKYLNNIVKNSNFVFTFDEGDAKKYKFNYHPQFYWIKDNKKENIIYDVLFIGRNKNRIKVLEKIYLELLDKDLKPYFYIIKDNSREKSQYIKLHKNALSYSEVLHLIAQSKSILDINHSTQTGLTLRVLEALFLKKKLISNNENLLNYNFYNANNIKIITNEIDITLEFFSTEFNKIDKNITNQYTFDYWLETLVNYGVFK